MSFTLRWKNPNAIATTVNIYRDTKDISPAALPAPIVTLTNGETEWRDPTAVPGQTYWYLSTVTANGKTVFTASQKYTIAVKRGIGPMTFIAGDDRLGFMGAVPYDELWTPGQMPAGFLAIFPTLLTDRVQLYKFSRHGKILYILGVAGQFPGYVNWASLYQAGLVFGRDDNGPAGANGLLTPTPQDAKILHNGDVYRMRLPRGLTDKSDSPVFPFNNDYQLKSHDIIPELTGYCEYNDLLYAMVGSATPEKQRWVKWNALSYTYLGQSGVSVGSSIINSGTLCMERDSVTERVLARGHISNPTIGPLENITRINYISPSLQGRYHPIFELVE
ncbi:putative virion structural protein [Erwinia phage vB_EamM_Phobos]|uniref:putative virion structural protein n=1 Tax=Erwinia phage vB_EamM_Phobos TaxID=1883377 RepID=UPI00081C7E62|nr:putative virion structural protein [Erwinia phage vB_EamM_Phobos]ANZ50337.1 putative virion structural protein [Erwinia phage vB_EamM_Phobos]